MHALLLQSAVPAELLHVEAMAALAAVVPPAARAVATAAPPPASGALGRAIESRGQCRALPTLVTLLGVGSRDEAGVEKVFPPVLFVSRPVGVTGGQYRMDESLGGVNGTWCSISNFNGL